MSIYDKRVYAKLTWKFRNHGRALETIYNTKANLACRET